MITYVKGNLFDAPKSSNTILVHACNCEGRWGSGIAVCFREKFPKAHSMYKLYCSLHGHTIIGDSIISGKEVPYDHSPLVGCLFTSRGYGKQKDSVKQILEATDKAVKRLFDQLDQGIQIHSPKINAGLFEVPWEKTAEIIEKHLATRPDLTWTVWEI